MHIQTIWKSDTQFNVEISSAEGKDAFLSVRGCRIANGKDGEFISPPSTKNENSGKWWSHAWFSERFGAEVLKLAKASKPGQKQEHSDDDIPW